MFQNYPESLAFQPLQITYNTEVLKFYYILAIGNITITCHNYATQVAFKNCAPFY